MLVPLEVFLHSFYTMAWYVHHKKGYIVLTHLHVFDKLLLVMLQAVQPASLMWNYTTIIMHGPVFSYIIHTRYISRQHSPMLWSFIWRESSLQTVTKEGAGHIWRSYNAKMYTLLRWQGALSSCICLWDLCISAFAAIKINNCSRLYCHSDRKTGQQKLRKSCEEHLQQPK